MTSTPQPPNWEELLAGYVLGDLDSEELVALREYLETHPESQQQVRELQETLALLPYALPESEPSPEILAKLLQTAQRSTKFSQKPEWVLGLPSVRLLLVGAIALAAIALGLDNLRLRHQLAAIDRVQLAQQQDLIDLLEQPNNRLVALSGMEPAPAASGSLVIAPADGRAVLMVKNLQPPSSGKVYRLWAVSNGKKIGCADFVPNEEGRVYVEISPDDLMHADTVAITLEPESAMHQPTGEMVMEGTHSL